MNEAFNDVCRAVVLYGDVQGISPSAILTIQVHNVVVLSAVTHVKVIVLITAIRRRFPIGDSCFVEK